MEQHIIDALLVVIILLGAYALFERSRNKTAEALNLNQSEKNDLLKLDQQKQIDTGSSDRSSILKSTKQKEKEVDNESDEQLADNINHNHD